MEHSGGGVLVHHASFCHNVRSSVNWMLLLAGVTCGVNPVRSNFCFTRLNDYSTSSGTHHDQEIKLQPEGLPAKDIQGDLDAQKTSERPSKQYTSLQDVVNDVVAPLMDPVVDHLQENELVHLIPLVPRSPAVLYVPHHAGHVETPPGGCHFHRLEQRLNMLLERKPSGYLGCASGYTRSKQ